MATENNKVINLLNEARIKSDNLYDKKEESYSNSSPINKESITVPGWIYEVDADKIYIGRQVAYNSKLGGANKYRFVSVWYGNSNAGLPRITGMIGLGTPTFPFAIERNLISPNQKNHVALEDLQKIPYVITFPKNNFDVNLLSKTQKTAYFGALDNLSYNHGQYRKSYEKTIFGDSDKNSFISFKLDKKLRIFPTFRMSYNTVQRNDDAIQLLLLRKLVVEKFIANVVKTKSVQLFSFPQYYFDESKSISSENWPKEYMFAPLDPNDKTKIQMKNSEGQVIETLDKPAYHISNFEPQWPEGSYDLEVLERAFQTLETTTYTKEEGPNKLLTSFYDKIISIARTQQNLKDSQINALLVEYQNVPKAVEWLNKFKSGETELSKSIGTLYSEKGALDNQSYSFQSSTHKITPEEAKQIVRDIAVETAYGLYDSEWNKYIKNIVDYGILKHEQALKVEELSKKHTPEERKALQDAFEKINEELQSFKLYNGLDFTLDRTVAIGNSNKYLLVDEPYTIETLDKWYNEGNVPNYYVFKIFETVAKQTILKKPEISAYVKEQLEKDPQGNFWRIINDNAKFNNAKVTLDLGVYARSYKSIANNQTYTQTNILPLNIYEKSIKFNPKRIWNGQIIQKVVKYKHTDYPNMQTATAKEPNKKFTDNFGRVDRIETTYENVINSKKENIYYALNIVPFQWYRLTRTETGRNLGKNYIDNINNKLGADSMYNFIQNARKELSSINNDSKRDKPYWRQDDKLFQDEIFESPFKDVVAYMNSNPNRFNKYDYETASSNVSTQTLEENYNRETNDLVNNENSDTNIDNNNIDLDKVQDLIKKTNSTPIEEPKEEFLPEYESPKEEENEDDKLADFASEPTSNNSSNDNSSSSIL